MSRTPLQGGFIVATLWILGQIVLWAVVAAATVFLAGLLMALLGGMFDPVNWRGNR